MRLVFVGIFNGDGIIREDLGFNIELFGGLEENEVVGVGDLFH